MFQKGKFVNAHVAFSNRRFDERCKWIQKDYDG